MKRHNGGLIPTNAVSDEDVRLISALLEKAGFTHETRFEGEKLTVKFTENITSLTPSELCEQCQVTICGMSQPNQARNGLTIFTYEGHELAVTVLPDSRVEWRFIHADDVMYPESAPSLCDVLVSQFANA